MYSFYVLVLWYVFMFVKVGCVSFGNIIKMFMVFIFVVFGVVEMIVMVLDFVKCF